MKLIAQSPIQHDGEEYGVGQPFEVKDEVQAQTLLDAGAAIEVVTKPKKAAEGEKE